MSWQVDCVTRFIQDSFRNPQEGITWVKKCAKTKESSDSQRIDKLADIIFNSWMHNCNDLESEKVHKLISESHESKLEVITEVLDSYLLDRKQPFVVQLKDGEVLMPRKFFSKDAKAKLKPLQPLNLPNVSVAVLKGVESQAHNDPKFLQENIFEIIELKPYYREFADIVYRVVQLLECSEVQLTPRLLKACLMMYDSRLKEHVEKRLTRMFPGVYPEYVLLNYYEKDIPTLTVTTDNKILPCLNFILSSHNNIALKTFNTAIQPAVLKLIFEAITNAGGVHSLLLWGDYPFEKANLTEFVVKPNSVKRLEFESVSNEDAVNLLDALAQRESFVQIDSMFVNQLNKDTLTTLYFHDLCFLYSLRGIVAELSSTSVRFEQLNLRLRTMPQNVNVQEAVAIYKEFDECVTPELLNRSNRALEIYRGMCLKFIKIMKTFELRTYSLEEFKLRTVHVTSAKLAQACSSYFAVHCISASRVADFLGRLIIYGLQEFKNVDEAYLGLRLAHEYLIGMGLIEKCRQRIIDEATYIRDINSLATYVGTINNLNDRRLMKFIESEHISSIDGVQTTWRYADGRLKMRSSAPLAGV